MRPRKAAERHHHRERHRQEPDCGRTQLRPPEADGHHRKDVVEAGDGVLQAGEEARRLPLLHVVPGPASRRGGREERALLPRRRTPPAALHRALRAASPSAGSSSTRRASRRRNPERLGPARPADLERPEGPLEKDDEENEGDLADLDADVEEKERQRNLRLRQPMAVSPLAKPKPCRRPKAKATTQGWRIVKARLAAPDADDLRAEEEDRKGDGGVQGGSGALGTELAMASVMLCAKVKRRDRLHQHPAARDDQEEAEDEEEWSTPRRMCWRRAAR